jgi:hypothetical protein
VDVHQIVSVDLSTDGLTEARGTKQTSREG